ACCSRPCSTRWLFEHLDGDAGRARGGPWDRGVCRSPAGRRAAGDPRSGLRRQEGPRSLRRRHRRPAGRGPGARSGSDAVSAARELRRRDPPQSRARAFCGPAADPRGGLAPVAARRPGPHPDAPLLGDLRLDRPDAPPCLLREVVSLLRRERLLFLHARALPRCARAAQVFHDRGRRAGAAARVGPRGPGGPRPASGLRRMGTLEPYRRPPYFRGAPLLRVFSGNLSGYYLILRVGRESIIIPTGDIPAGDPCRKGRFKVSALNVRGVKTLEETPPAAHPGVLG